MEAVAGLDGVKLLWKSCGPSRLDPTFSGQTGEAGRLARQAREVTSEESFPVAAWVSRFAQLGLWVVETLCPVCRDWVSPLWVGALGSG